MAIRSNSAVPQILEDNNQGQMSFGHAGAIFSITIGVDPLSWFETIKDAHRNGRAVSITDDDSATRNTFQGNACSLPLDLHNS